MLELILTIVTIVCFAISITILALQNRKLTKQLSAHKGLGNQLHNLACGMHYAGHEKWADEVSAIAMYLWTLPREEQGE